jgi:hypothetical protein
MTSVSYTALLSNWFRVHIPFSQKQSLTSVPRTGCAAAYPPIKSYHRRQSCIPFIYKSKKKNKTYLSNNNRSNIQKKTSSIKGCASFARFDRYEEGESEDDC